jgi:hypothetical protein
MNSFEGDTIAIQSGTMGYYRKGREQLDFYKHSQEPGRTLVLETP